MNRAQLTLLVGSAVFTALGQAPVGPWAPVCASLGWALAAIAKGLDLASLRRPSQGSPALPPVPDPPSGREKPL